MVTRVFVDADVLFLRTLRDWLFLTKLESGGGMYTVSTSLEVIAEATARYRDRNPTAPGRVIVEMFERISANIDERVDEYTVDGSFEGVDAGDAHVDAAVRACGAGVLLTVDSGWHKMPEEQLDALPYEPLHPDEFFCIVEASARSLMEKVIVKQMTYWFRRSGAADLPAALRAAGCTEFRRTRPPARRGNGLLFLDCTF